MKNVEAKVKTRYVTLLTLVRANPSNVDFALSTRALVVANDAVAADELVWKSDALELASSRRGRLRAEASACCAARFASRFRISSCSAF